jgi:hypothetical protein
MILVLLFLSACQTLPAADVGGLAAGTVERPAAKPSIQQMADAMLAASDPYFRCSQVMTIDLAKSPPTERPEDIATAAETKCAVLKPKVRQAATVIYGPELAPQIMQRVDREFRAISTTVTLNVRALPQTEKPIRRRPGISI